MNRAKQLFRSLANGECGSDLIEYALIASLFALVAVACGTMLSGRILAQFHYILVRI